MERKVLAYLINTGTKLASDGICIAVSQSLRQKAKERLESPSPPEVVEQTDHDHEVVQAEMVNLEKVAEREAGGDYCPYCPANKHFPKVIDALEDARNIYDRQGRFTEVATKKIQHAVKELDGAEVDLEQGVIDPSLDDLVKDLRVQEANLRNFLRADRSGLEIADENIRPQQVMREDLNQAIASAEKLRKLGYKLAVATLKKRMAKTKQTGECQEPECQEVRQLWQKVQGGAK